MAKSNERKFRKKLQCTVCKNIAYYIRKNDKLKDRLELNKHCKFCKKHTLHKETK